MAEFDAYSNTYNQTVQSAMGSIGRNYRWYTQGKVDALLACLQKRHGDTASLKVLDFGCGTGETDTLLQGNFRSLHGLDISSKAVATAQRKNPWVTYNTYDESTIPYADNQFDVIFMICVMHHIYPAKRTALLHNIMRILRPGGSLVIFEHNPLNPLTRLVVFRCEFDKDAILLSKRNLRMLLETAGFSCYKEDYLFFCPFAIGAITCMAPWIHRIPLGAQYFVAAEKP